MKRLNALLKSHPLNYARADIPRKALWPFNVAMITLIAFFVLFNLDKYPAISGWDEGIFLQFSENLAVHNTLATRNGATFEQLNPTSSVGPTLIAPVSTMLSFSGRNLLAVRLIAAFYLLVAFAGVYFLVTLIFDQRAGLMAVLFFLIAGHVDFDTLWLGRQVIGEAPMLAFLFWGLWAWLKSWERNNDWRLLTLSAILLALAVITKGQLLLLIAPSFAVIAFLDIVYYRRLTWLARLLPLIGVLIGYVSWWVILVPLLADEANRAVFLANQSAMTKAFLTISPLRIRMNLGYLFKSGQWWTLAAIPYVLWLSRTRSVMGLQISVLPILASLSLLIYIFVHVPWGRYVQTPVMLAGLCMAAAIADITERLGARYTWKPAVRTAMWVAVIAIITTPRLAIKTDLILNTNDTSAQEFAALIEDHVPPEEEIVNWEWEIEFFSDRAFLHPPYALFPAMFDNAYNQRPHAILNDPRVPEGVEFLIVGPAATNLQLFREVLEEESHQIVAQVDNYALYRLELD